MRWPFRLFIALSAVAGISAGFLTWAYHYRNDEALGALVSRLASGALRGRMHFGSIHWYPRAVLDVAFGTPTPAIVVDFRVYDPKGNEVINVPRATASMDLNALLARRDVRIQGVRAARAAVNVTEIEGPDGDAEIGLFAAFTTPGPKRGGGRGSAVAFRDVKLRGTSLRMRFADWALELDGMTPSGEVIYDGGEVDDLVLNNSFSAQKGRLIIGGRAIALGEIKASRVDTTAERGTMALRLALSMAGAPTRMEGRILRVFHADPEVDLSLSTRRAHPLLQHLLGDFAGGPLARGDFRLHGPLVRPRVSGGFEDVQLTVGGIDARAVSGRVEADAAKGHLGIGDVRALMLGGRLVGTAELDGPADNWRASFEVAGLDTGKIDEALQGKLTGDVTVSGRLRGGGRGLAVVDLDWTRPRKDHLPRKIGIEGSAHLGPETVELAGVKVSGRGNSIVARGTVGLRELRTDVRLELSFPRLEHWLKQRGIPVELRVAGGDLVVKGRFPRLRASGRVVAKDVGYGHLRLPSVRAEVRFDRGTLELRNLRADGMGGQLRGAASFDLFAGSLIRPRRRPTMMARLRVAGAELGQLSGARRLQGKAAANVTIKGPLTAPVGTATVRIAGLEVDDDRYRSASFRVGLLSDRLTVYASEVTRRGGGTLRAWGDLFFGGELAMRVRAQSFPLEALPQVRELPIEIGGRLTGQLTIGGRLNDPRLSGSVGVADARVRGMDLGVGQIQLKPSTKEIRIAGHLFGKHFKVDGTVTMQPVTRLHLSLGVSEFPLQQLFPEMRKVGDVRAAIDGRIELDADSQRGLTWVSAQFPKLDASLHYRAPGSRQSQVIRVRNRDELLARYEDGRLKVVKAKVIADTGGKGADFSVGGWISDSGSDLRLRGRIALRLLEFFLARRVRKVSGNARANLRLTGPPAAPELQGSLVLDQAAFFLPKFDRPLKVPRGTIRLVPGALRVARLPLQVGEQRLVVSGEVGLARFRPTTAKLDVFGSLNMRLVQALFSEQLSHAAGAATVRLRIDGPLADPRVQGRLGLQRVELSPRGWGRTLTLTEGQIGLSNYHVRTLGPIRGTYDEGTVRVSGEMRMDRWEPVDLALHLTGSGIPFRQPKVYRAEANLNLNLVGDSRELVLSGEVDLVDARYVREFDIVKRALIRPRTFEEQQPFWVGRPLLENLVLKLLVRSAGQLTVQNRYGKLALDGTLLVDGTLADPRLHGQIRVEEGKFRIPFLRGDYQLERGEIVFDRKRPVEEAMIDITAENQHVDRNGVEYTIKLNLEGPLHNVHLGLSSQPPLDPGQIATLLFTGRTTDELRSQLRGDPQAAGGAAGAADSSVKQFTGDILGGIIEDQITKSLRLDLFRLELGTESLGVRACKKFSRYVESCVDYEKGLVGEDQRAEALVGAKLHDYLKLVGRAQRITTRIETEQENPTRVRLELKYQMRLR